MSTLYEIKGELFELMQMMEEDPENPVIADTLEALKGELELKAEGYCKVIQEFLAQAARIKEEIARLKIREERAEKNAKKMKDALYAAMLDTDTQRIRGTLFTLYIKNNAESLDLIPDNLPDRYLINQDPVVNKKLLLADIKAGTKVEGVTTKRTQSLIIR